MRNPAENSSLSCLRQAMPQRMDVRILAGLLLPPPQPNEDGRNGPETFARERTPKDQRHGPKPEGIAFQLPGEINQRLFSL